MKYGVMADIHANVPALNRVLEMLRQEHVEGYIVAGDLVGYGPYPNECIDIIKGLPNATIVVGNHDWAVIDLEDISTFNEQAQAAIQWTKSVLTPGSVEYISSLEYVEHHDNWMVVHGSPRDPLDEYLITVKTAEKSIPFLKEKICFVGHSHEPLHIRHDQGQGQMEIKELRDNEITVFDSESVHFFNPGSVGQPRDHNPKASCAILDTQLSTFRIVRIDYDITLVQEEMRKYSLPEFLVKRLESGV